MIVIWSGTEINKNEKIRFCGLPSVDSVPEIDLLASFRVVRVAPVLDFVHTPVILVRWMSWFSTRGVKRLQESIVLRECCFQDSDVRVERTAGQSEFCVVTAELLDEFCAEQGQSINQFKGNAIPV